MLVLNINYNIILIITFFIIGLNVLENKWGNYIRFFIDRIMISLVFGWIFRKIILLFVFCLFFFCVKDLVF